MKWIYEYQLFLFDFDGLLVDTEQLHYQAYCMMCANRGHTLPWDFARFCLSAHVDDSTRLKTDIYQTLPKLHSEEPSWNILYEEKKQAYMQLLKTQSIDLMPGAEKLLQLLAKAKKSLCVVTNSTRLQIETIKQQNPLLQNIAHWIVREDYTHAKPHPEAYLLAIEKFAKSGDKIIGFEDSVKGTRALLNTPAKPILINTVYPKALSQEIEQKKVTYFPSLNVLLSNNELP